MSLVKTGIAAAAMIAGCSLTALADPAYRDGAPADAPGTVVVPSGDGASSGSTGYESPAGIPADPTTNENVQPGPSTNTPGDPAAGSNEGARVPTSPPGTGSSSP
jgi:hypothetical protein